MNCDNVRPRLTALLDGELEPAEREKCERHLARCGACAEILIELRTIQQAPPFAFEAIDVWRAVQDEIAPDIQTREMLAEMRAMREEMKALSREVSDLRQVLSQAGASRVPSTALDLPYVRKSTPSRFQLV